MLPFTVFLNQLFVKKKLRKHKIFYLKSCCLHSIFANKKNCLRIATAKLIIINRRPHQLVSFNTKHSPWIKIFHKTTLQSFSLSIDERLVDASRNRATTLRNAGEAKNKKKPVPKLEFAFISSCFPFSCPLI